ncbi:uncharacterized protein BKA78DRAFT_143586 [Phyllosticta capitalensis]|uniref:uncharacterized protein n=1 Tax=Phyllosticta capitalensis TaxID=121624 RepID=UPI00312F8699
MLTRHGRPHRHRHRYRHLSVSRATPPAPVGLALMAGGRPGRCLHAFVVCLSGCLCPLTRRHHVDRAGAMDVLALRVSEPIVRCEARLPAGLSSTTLWWLVVAKCWHLLRRPLKSRRAQKWSNFRRTIWVDTALRSLVELAMANDAAKAPTAVSMYLRSTRTSDRQHPKCRQHRPARPDQRECLAFQPPQGPPTLLPSASKGQVRTEEATTSPSESAQEPSRKEKLRELV